MRLTRALIRALLACAGLVAVAASATVIYRWVDENGRTQVSDTVPEKYRKSATRIDSGRYDVAPERLKEAEKIAAREKAVADDAARRRAGASPLAPASTASAPATARRPAQGVTDSTDCETWWRLYEDSEACFGPYRMVGGGVKVEAFERCNPIPSPEVKCGPLRQ